MYKCFSLEEMKECCKDPNFCAVCSCNRTDVKVKGNICEECQKFHDGIPNRLPTVTYKGKQYFIDWRLKEFRTVLPPLEFVPFDSELGREIDSALD